MDDSVVLWSPTNKQERNCAFTGDEAEAVAVAASQPAAMSVDTARSGFLISHFVDSFHRRFSVRDKRTLAKHRQPPPPHEADTA